MLLFSFLNVKHFFFLHAAIEACLSILMILTLLICYVLQYFCAFNFLPFFLKLLLSELSVMQFVIYKEIRERFPYHLWLDVVSKCDLLQESPVVYIMEDGNVDHLELARYRKVGPDGALHVSIKSEVSIVEVCLLASAAS